jgi:predicted RND superfamily exporter protein
MRTAITTSGILGFILLVVSSIGLFAELPYNKVIFITSLGLLVLVFFPLSIIDRYRQNKNINKIIDSYKSKEKESIKMKQGKPATKGWSMNNSPFRERKSGLNWGGGNIKGANASRGKRKSFFK